MCGRLAAHGCPACLSVCCGAAVEEVGPFSYRVSVAFPKRECTLADVIESFRGKPLPMDWIER